MPSVALSAVATSWKLRVKWLQACCRPLVRLDGLLLDGSVSQGDSSGWLKELLLKKVMPSLPSISQFLLSVLIISGRARDEGTDTC